MLAPRGTSKHKLEPNFLTKNPTFDQHPIFTRVNEEEYHVAIRCVEVTQIWSGCGTDRMHPKFVSGVKMLTPPKKHFVLHSIVFEDLPNRFTQILEVGGAVRNGFSSETIHTDRGEKVGKLDDRKSVVHMMHQGKTTCMGLRVGVVVSRKASEWC